MGHDRWVWIQRSANLPNIPDPITENQHSDVRTFYLSTNLRLEKKATDSARTQEPHGPSAFSGKKKL